MSDGELHDDELLGNLGDAIEPAVPPVDPARRAAVRAQAEAAAGSAPGAPVAPLTSPTPSRRSLFTLGAAAAVGGIAAGATGALLFQEDPPAGPPLERAVLRADPAIEATATMIDHTWGLEVLLDATGLTAGEAYRIHFQSTEGTVVDAGGFVGVAGLMKCRNNGPLLRADTRRWFVTAADGREVISAELT